MNLLIFIRIKDTIAVNRFLLHKSEPKNCARLNWELVSLDFQRDGTIQNIDILPVKRTILIDAGVQRRSISMFCIWQ